jgi:hypothetical protein
MKHRNKTVYRAILSGLKGEAFGVPHTFQWIPEIEIYQARVSPELWRARPNFQRIGHTWEAGTAEALMNMVTRDFVDVIKPWRAFDPDGAIVLRPSLVSPAKDAGTKTGS